MNPSTFHPEVPHGVSPQILPTHLLTGDFLACWERKPSSQIQLLAINYILHRRVVYYQYLTPMIANSHGAIQAGFLLFLYRFLHYNITIYPAKLSDNIMLAKIINMLIPLTQVDYFDMLTLCHDLDSRNH